MPDYRDLFNALTCSSVEAMQRNASGRKALRWLSGHKILERDSIASFLWEAFRETNTHTTIGWVNFEAYRKKDRLIVDIVLSRSPKVVHQTFSIPTSPVKEDELFSIRDYLVKKKKEIGVVADPMLCKQYHR